MTYRLWREKSSALNRNERLSFNVHLGVDIARFVHSDPFGEENYLLTYIRSVTVASLATGEAGVPNFRLFLG